MQQTLGPAQQAPTTRALVVLVCLLLFCQQCQTVAAQPGGVGIAGSWPSSLNQYVQTTVRVTLNTSACGQWGQDAGDDAQLVLQHVTAQGGSLAFTTISPSAAADGSSAGSADCTSFDFPVLLDGSSKHGNISACLLLPKAGLDLRLQEPIVVEVPLLLSVVSHSINVSADSTPFAVGVSLNRPAPAGGVSVQLKLGQEEAAKVKPSVLYWPEGAADTRNFTVTLSAAPEQGVLTARLSSPTGGAVLHPAAAAVKVAVDSPVVSFTTNLGYYRGVNSSAAPKLMLKMTGASAFPTQFAFSTYLLSGSRPSLQPCHPLAPSCSVADQEAVDNITLSGSRYVTPGQRGIPPVVLPLTWGRLPPEAELRVGVRIVSISNCRVARQAGEVAAIVFGTPPGHCPPGAVLASGAGDLVSNGSRSGSGRNSDRPTYTVVAALQELALVLDHQAVSQQDDFDRSDSTDRRRLLTVPSSTGAPTSTCSNCTRDGVSQNKTAAASSSRAAGVGVAVMPSTAAAAKAAAVLSAAASTNSSKDARSGGSSSRVLDLDPPFRPLVDRYIALLPPGSAGGHLMLSSSRWGDVTVVDATACGGLQSARYTVAWDHGQQLWREYFPLAGQNVPCWIRVHVFTRLLDSTSTAAPSAQDAEQGWAGTNANERGLRQPAADAHAHHPSVGAAPPAGPARRPLQLPMAAAAGPPAADSTQAGSSNGSARIPDIWSSAAAAGEANGTSSTSSTSSSPSVWDLPADFVLYRSYTVRFVPLRPPEQLSLSSISFSNNATVVIACGVPSAFQHLFVLPKPQQPAAANSDVRAVSIMSSNYAAASSRAAVQRGNSSHSTGALQPAAVAGGSAFAPLTPGAELAGGGQDTAASDDSTRAGPRAMLTAAPGVDVQVAYLLTKPQGSNGSTPAQDVAAAAKVPTRLRMQQFSVFDRASNRTVVWSRFTAAECAQDHYILLPMAQLKPDMKMVPELVDSEGFTAGVNIAMSAAAVALPGELGGVNSSTSGSSSSAGASSSGGQLGVPSEGSSSVSSWLLGQKFQGSGYGGGNPAAAAAAAAALDGGKGFGGAGPKNLGEQVWCSKNSSVVRTRLAQGSEGDAGCRLQLPGLTAELPIILTADEGRSSRTYTMLLYSNTTAATAVHDMVLPQEAAAGVARAGSGSEAADAAALSAAYFADRPGDWPRSPAQGSQCNVCPNGTYSLRTDASECKVCPPGKYAASPFSTTCLFCPPGSFSYYWGAPTCRTCLPGTYAAGAGSLFCDICREGTTTRAEGATQCEVMVAGGSTSRLDSMLGSADVAVLLSFGLLLDGTTLESVSRSLTGINGSSEGIVGVLVRGDTATALNISLGSVQVLAVQQIGSRQLLVNVSAALPVSTDVAADTVQQDLSADPLIQRLIDDPNTFLRTTQTLGAESASVKDITTQMTQRAKWRHHLQLHAILWPTLAGCLLLAGLGSWGWRRRRRRQLQLAQIASGPADPGGAVATGGGLAALFGSGLQQRGARGGGGAVGHAQWSYGDGFMSRGAAAAPAGDDAYLGRSSINSSDAGDVAGRRGPQRGLAGTWRDLQRLLSSQLRFVLKVQGVGPVDGSRPGGSGASSPSSADSPSRSSCGASDADSMERGVDEYRVKVLVAGSSGSEEQQAVPSLHQHDLCLREESFAARLRAKQPRPE